MLIKEIVYPGMTNSANGLQGRLKQFDNTIVDKSEHGSVERFLFKHKSYKTLTKNLYISVNSVKYNIRSNRPEDLYKTGEVVNCGLKRDKRK